MRIQIYQSEYNDQYEFNLIHGCGMTFNYKGLKFATEQEARMKAQTFIIKTREHIGECRNCWKPL